MSEIIYEDSTQGIVMRVDDGSSKEGIDLLKATIWGTEGLKYLSRDVVQEISRIPKFRMIHLMQGETLLGVYGIAEKIISIGGEKATAVHRMWLAVDRKYQGQGFGKLLVEQTKWHFFGKGVQLLYGYIEAENSRSLQLAQEVGYRSMGEFQSILFSRFRYRSNLAIEQPDNEDELRSLLSEYYSEFALCDLEQSLIVPEYYVVRDREAIVAGIQADRKSYSIVDFGGWYSSLLLHGLPKIPYLQRLLPNGNLDFLLVSNLYIAPGFEDEFLILLEGLLALHKVNVAMALIDRKSPVFDQLQAVGHFGLLSKLGVGSTVHVMVGYNHISDDMIADFSRRPIFISPLDPI